MIKGNIKKGVRILAIEGSDLKEGKDCLVVCTIWRQDLLEGVISFYVKKDGSDSASKIISKVKRSRFKEQIKVIITHGTTIAGLNVIDISRIYKELKLPVIAITRKKPHPDLLSKAIFSSKMLSEEEKEKRSNLLDLIGKRSSMTSNGGYYAQFIGIKEQDAKTMIEGYASKLRVSHIITSGISRGESRGRI